MTCINKNTVEFQTLLKMSGLSEFIVDAYSSYYLENYGRYPELDELPLSDSTEHLKHFLNVHTIKDTNFSNNKQILKNTSSENIDEAIIKINNKYRDLETDIIPSGDISILKIKKRPSQWEGINNNFNRALKNTPNMSTGSIVVMLEKLSHLYGINFKYITNEELNSESWKDKVLDARTTNAFVFNNDIYINIDNYNIDAPIHEMLHILLGSIRFTKPTLYFNLVNMVNNIPNKEKYLQKYLNRTNSDLNEELLVSEFSKYLSGLDSIYTNLPDNIKYEIEYNIKRVLDSMLSGEQSVKTLSDEHLFNSSMLELANLLGSETLNNKFQGSLEDSQVHRILANTKEDLIKKGDLIEYCS